MPPEAPRLAYPLRLHPGGATIVEQDTIDDLVSSAFFIIRTPPGWRPEAPGVGVDDPLFELAPAAQIVREVERSDPRLALRSSEERDLVELRIRLEIGGATP